MSTQNTSLIALNASMDGIAILDSNETYVYLNQAHAKCYGYDSPNELIGKSWNILYDARELDALKGTIMPTLRKLGQWHGETLGKKKDGSLFPQELSLNTTSEGGLVCVVRDITERKNTDESLRLIAEITTATTALEDLSDITAVSLEKIAQIKNWKALRAWDTDPGQGIVSQVWKEMRPICSNNRCAIPVKSGNMIFTVLEFSHENPKTHHPELFHALEKIGSHIGLLFERKLAQQETQRSASLLKATLESTTEGILVVDQNDRLALYNDHFVKMWRIPHELLQAGNDVRAFKYALSQLKNPGRFQAQLAGLRNTPDRETFDILEFVDGRIFEHSSVPQRLNEKIVGHVWSFRDVTLAKRTERELADLVTRERIGRAQAENQEQAAAFLAEASTMLDASLDYEGTLSAVVKLPIPKIADWCALDIAESDGSWTRMTLGTPGIPEGELATLGLKVVQAGASEFLDKLESVYIGVPLRVKGKVLGALTLGATTAEREYSKQDVSFVEDLGRRCALAIDNARLYRDAQEAIRARADFISVASHELKTPITALQGSVQLLLRKIRRNELATLPYPTQLGLIESAEAQCRKLVKFIDNLLDVSKIGAHMLRLEIECFSFLDVVQDVLSRLKPEVDIAKYQITLHARGENHGEWDRLRIEQVVTNLITNAMKYGEGRPIELFVESSVETLNFKVVDHGIGIPEENQARIFNRFERAVSGRSYHGTGLGLWIVQKILEAHSGTIRVESKLGAGSTFIVEIPRHFGAVKKTA